MSAVDGRATFLIRNQLPKRLEIVGAGHTLKLAPLQQVRVDYRPQDHLGPAALHARTDRAVAWEREPVRSTRVLATAWLALVAAVSLGGSLAMVLWDPRQWWGAAAALILAVLCIVIAGMLNRPEPFTADESAAGEVRERFNGWRFTKDVALSALQKLALVIVLAVGILGPTVAIYYGSELSTILPVDGWLDLSLVTGEESYPVIVARGLQIVLVVILALIPGLMYFQFDREKLTTLMDRWVHYAFRLDPTLHTLSDVDAKYGRRVEEFYGAAFECGVAVAKKRTTTRSPLFIATALLGLGWIVVLLQAPVDLSVQSGSLVAPAEPSLPLIQDFIQPRFTPMTSAFLGAYFFSVHVVLLGYVRGDLRPKTYNVVSVRILVAVILAWMLQGLFGDPRWVLATSFLAGVVPDTVVRYIRDAATQVPAEIAQRLSRRASTRRTDGDPDGDSDPEPFDELGDRSPLTDLDGIGIYERTRLAEEGITSVQALARHDLVDLMLSSRIPASRLIDWLDQALLYQHVTTDDRRRLRTAGIRTATELLAAARNREVKGCLHQQVEDGASRLPLILASLRNDEWLAYITHWRSHDDTREPGRIVYTETGLQPVLVPVGGGGEAEVAGPTSVVPA